MPSEARITYMRNYTRLPSSIARRKKLQQIWYQNNKERVKERKLIKKYDLTLSEYKNLLAQQNNKCAICSVDLETLSLKSIHVDHCHDTERVRGILCHKCNIGLGHFTDDPNLLEKAILYLRKG